MAKIMLGFDIQREGSGLYFALNNKRCWCVLYDIYEYSEEKLVNKELTDD